MKYSRVIELVRLLAITLIATGWLGDRAIAQQVAGTSSSNGPVTVTGTKCTGEEALFSLSTGTDTELTVTNSSKKTYRLWEILNGMNSYGRLVGEVSAGSSAIYNVDQTHWFMITDASDNCLASFIPTPRFVHATIFDTLPIVFTPAGVIPTPQALNTNLGGPETLTGTKCAGEDNLVSYDVGQNIALAITNATQKAYRLYEVLNHDYISLVVGVNPESSVVLSGRQGFWYMITDASENCIQYFLPAPRLAQVTIFDNNAIEFTPYGVPPTPPASSLPSSDNPDLAASRCPAVFNGSCVNRVPNPLSHSGTSQGGAPASRQPPSQPASPPQHAPVTNPPVCRGLIQADVASLRCSYFGPGSQICDFRWPLNNEEGTFTWTGEFTLMSGESDVEKRSIGGITNNGGPSQVNCR